jgi:acyl transferase domain-containing protein/phosphopantetheinyl transferase (holo-ACP synthase)
MTSPHPLEPIAVIGMACIFPQAPDLQTFWNNVLSGIDAVGEPQANWDASRYLESGRIKTASGGYLKDLYTFDPREFGIMPNSMDGGEPDQFLALRVARDALLDSGYLRPDFDHRDTGIILGHSTYLHRGQATLIQNNTVLDQTIALLQAALPDLDAQALAQMRKTLAAKLPPTNADTAPGLVPNVMTGRIANRLNLRGPNYLVDAACSSSLLAVSAAMDELRSGRSRLMLAGGVNATLPADVATIFTQLGALSVRGKVRPFESGSDGTLLGEGLGVVVLKRLSDALADGDRIYSVVRGVGQASDGRGTGLLAPSVDGETLAIRRAYDTTGVDPASVSLIEAHGTGIPLGDKTEISALKNVFGERTAAQGSIALGSVKSMISHCIPAAGIAGLIKTSLALHHRVLPPTLCDQVNPELGISSTRLFVNTETMPWISPLGAPRRGGVDSFGFGGINTHAIVEQAPDAAKRPTTLTRWPFEVCVLSAPTAAGLITEVEQLLGGLERNPGWRLDEIAAAMLAADSRQEARLALVVKSRDALVKGLKGALTKLGEGKSASWFTRAGVYFANERQTGKLAFIFPGEGSQYLGMFADLAMCFEEVQQWLDFWRGLYPDEPGNTRTDIAFPPANELTPERRKQLEARLHDMDVGSEAVMVGGQAMFALLRSLGVEPDVMLGHSSGESSALVASKALPAKDMAELASLVRQLNVVYQRVLQEGKIPTGALLAVGALPATMVHETLAAAGLTVQVPMDNCANQLVLYADRATIDAATERLIAIGGICLPLPFDRGYHTPDFDAVSAAFLEYYKAIKVGVPQVPLYSCASAQRFPQTPAAVRKLAAAQWSSTVRFRETVLNMVADGVSCFLEVGPSGNLTAFVDDILADQPHVALATNVRRKHGLEQLLCTLAQLHVQGRPVALQALFAKRQIAIIDLKGSPATPKLAPLLDNTMPVIRFSKDDQQLLQRLVASGLPAAVKAPANAPATSAPAAAIAPAPAAAPAEEVQDASAQVQVMGDYFSVMRVFLAQQQQALSGWQGGDGYEPAHATQDENRTPFLSAITFHDAQRLVAECHLSVQEQAFLRDHVLSGRNSDTDPGLLGLACVPMMVSLEIMAEACAALAGNARLTVIEKVRAFDWIALDDEEMVVEVSAEVLDAAAGTYAVTLRKNGAVAVSAQCGFAPDWRIAGLQPLGELRAPRWDGHDIYSAGMFHGPIFQSLDRTLGWSAQGIDATLTPCSLDGFFTPGEPASMIVNPVLLDAMGQLAACWIAENIGLDFNCFPSTIERIEFYDAGLDEHAGVALSARQHAIDPAGEADITSTRSWSFEAASADGRPLMRVTGLVNVFFPVPHGYCTVRTDPLSGWLGAPMVAPGGAELWQLDHLSEEFCSQSNAIFMRILAHATLSFEEREEWRQLQRPVRQAREWLLGRLCLKEAVRHWLYRRTGELVYPADVIVLHDEHGAPVVDGWWVGRLAAAPRVSLSHNSRTNLAAVLEGNFPVGVDLEDLGGVKRPELLTSSFTADEQTWLNLQPLAQREESMLRLWCAKEAAAKWLGTGLQGSPEAFEVNFVPGTADQALVRWQDKVVGVLVRRVGNSVMAVTEADVSIFKVQ